MTFLCQNKTIEAPALLGKTVDVALVMTSAHHVYLRVTDTKTDTDLPSGTIMSQIPAAGKSIKENQTLYITITQKPVAFVMPDLYNKNETDISNLLSTTQAKLHKFYLEYDQTPGICIAQYPETMTVSPKEIFVYMNKESQKLVIMPDLKDKPLHEVLSFLTLYNITPHVLSMSPDHRCDTCIIIDQRPLAGTIINVHEKSIPAIQLQVIHV